MSDKKTTVELIKFDLDTILSTTAEAPVDGEFMWPIHPTVLSKIYQHSAEHCRCITIKTESAFGGGSTGDSERLEVLFETGATEAFALLGLDLETYGNAFLQRVYTPDGQRLLALRRLPAITMSRTINGYLQRITQHNGKVKKTKFNNREIIHLRELCPRGQRYATPSWIGAQGMLELAIAAVKFNAKFFENNAVPEYLVKYKGGIPSKKDQEAIVDFFRNETQGIDNAHRTLFTTIPEDGDLIFDRLTAEMKDADFLKMLDAARERIIMAHGVPPRMLGIMSAGQLFTFEHLLLRPKRRRMLDQLRPVFNELGLRAGHADAVPQKNEIAFKPLDLTPPKDDAENLPELVSAGIISADEARAILPALVQSATDAPEQPITRSADQPQIDVLAGILGKI